MYSFGRWADSKSGGKSNSVLGPDLNLRRQPHAAAPFLASGKFIRSHELGLSLSNVLRLLAITQIPGDTGEKSEEVHIRLCVRLCYGPIIASQTYAVAEHFPFHYVETRPTWRARMSWIHDKSSPVQCIKQRTSPAIQARETLHLLTRTY